MAMQRVAKTPVNMRVFEEHYVKLSTTRDTHRHHLEAWKLDELEKIIRKMEGFRAVVQQGDPSVIRKAKSELMVEVDSTFFDIK